MRKYLFIAALIAAVYFGSNKILKLWQENIPPTVAGECLTINMEGFTKPVKLKVLHNDMSSKSSFVSIPLFDGILFGAYVKYSELRRMNAKQVSCYEND